MIIAFETDDSKTLSNFLHIFEHPEDSGTEIKSLWNSFILSYFNRKVYRIDKVVIIEMEGIFEMASRLAVLLTSMGLLCSLIFRWNILMGIMIPLIILFVCLLSPDVRTLLYIFRIKVLGHKPKIKFISNKYIIEKLLFERDKFVSK